MNARRIALLVATPIVAGAVFAGGMWYGAGRVRGESSWADGRLLSTAIDSVRANALDSLPNDELIRRAVSGMLRELQDPYAALLRPDSFQRYRNSLQGIGEGLGLSLRRQPAATGITVHVSRVAPGSPAAEAGVRPGDRILSVNDIPVADGWGRPATDTSKTPLDRARLVLVRAPGADTLRLELPHAEWRSAAVTESSMLTDSVGYVRLSTITARSTAELERTVEGLRERGAMSLVLDLRGNAGGLFEEGVRIAGLFLPRGALVASLDARRGAPPEQHTSRNTRWPSLPLTVLVDGNTASAAEIIAAALHDHGRALLVGHRTYGKGVVQRVVPITKELSLRLTTARWLTPRGVALQRRSGNGAEATGGLVPDVVLDDVSRKDAFSIPRDWPRESSIGVSAVADSVAERALRERWTLVPLNLFETRVREAVVAALPARVRGERARASWTHVATRLATVRAIESAAGAGGGSAMEELLLRYSVRDDAALRAGVDVLAPGSELTRVTVASLDAASASPATTGDARTARGTSRGTSRGISRAAASRPAPR